MPGSMYASQGCWCTVVCVWRGMLSCLVSLNGLLSHQEALFHLPSMVTQSVPSMRLPLLSAGVTCDSLCCWETPLGHSTPGPSYV